MIGLITIHTPIFKYDFDDTENANQNTKDKDRWKPLLYKRIRYTLLLIIQSMEIIM